MTQVSDPTGSYGFGYDNMGRLINTTTQYTFLPGQTFTNSYTYDAASNRLSLSSMPDGNITTYGYDSINELTGLVNSSAGSFTFGYDALSRRTSLTRPNGITTTYGYDPVSRLTSILHKLGATVVDGATYTYDNAGNRQAKTDQRTGTTSTYGYDNIYQLLSVTQGSTTTESYTYDLVGNRLSSLGVSPYAYNTSNQLTSTPSMSYTYDNDGNTKTRSDGTQYTWDFENRLTKIVLPGTGGTVTFKYDPFGRRVQKSGPSGTSNYLYDGKNSMEEVDSSGNLLARYTQTLNFDDPLAELRSGTTTYYQSDRTKSITSLTDPASAIVGTYAYDAFGNLSSSTGSLTNPFRYTGREFDAEIGLYYYRTRYYDSAIGRFASEDPIGFKGGVNFYPYVKNRPVTFGDPMGTCLWQFDSVTTTLGQCGKDPNKDRQCACICQVSPEYAGCVKDCKDGCLSPKFSLVESCQCGCDQRHKSGELNGFETWACKQFCKLGGK